MLKTRTRRAGALALAVVMSAGALAAMSRSAEAAGGCRTFWVAPDGHDGAPGTKKAPFKTVQHARDVIRAKDLTRNMKCDVTVNLEAGEYPVTSTIELDDRDSGSNGHQVVYRSADGPGKANLVGAEEVTGWEPYQDGIYKTKIDT